MRVALIYFLFLSTISLVVSNANAASSTPEKFFEEYATQPQKITIPERATLAGDMSSFHLSGSKLSSGEFSISMPLNFPEERAPLIYNFIPIYSPSMGIAEFGMGWNLNLSIYRFRNLGEIKFDQQDDLVGAGIGIFKRTARVDLSEYLSKGLQSRHRLLMSNDQKTITAYLDNGVTLIFGEENIIQSDRGVHAWYISRGFNARGDFFTVKYSKNSTGKPYILTIDYGQNNKIQYQIKYDYDNNVKATAFSDYHSGREVKSDKRVSAITIYATDWSNNQFKARYRYDLKYINNKADTIFYLDSITRSYSNSNNSSTTTQWIQDNPIKYSYDLKDLDKIAPSEWKKVDKVNTFLKKYASRGEWIFTQKRYAAFDDEDDGLLDMEFGKNFNLIKHYPDKMELIQDGPLDSARENPMDCANDNDPRTLLKFFGPNDDYYVVYPYYNSGRTNIYVCNRKGKLLTTFKTEEKWKLQDGTRIVDLNGDGLPDFIKAYNGKYTIMKNISTYTIIGTETKKNVSFDSKLIIGKLDDWMNNPDGFWVVDMNGDGIPDVVAKYGKAIYVWPGKGNFVFGPEKIRLEFFDQQGDSAGHVRNYQLMFKDINGDGLTDAFIVSANTLTPFINKGNKFAEDRMPAIMSIKMLMSIYPTLSDFNGNGNLQISIMSDNAELWALEVSTPATGLMTAIGDGRGNQVKFEYKRMKPAPGVKVLRPILSKMTWTSTGYGFITEEYDYEQANISTLNGRFLGYGKVYVKESGNTEGIRSKKSTYVFKHNDELQGLVRAEYHVDSILPKLYKFVENKFAEFNYQGVNGIRSVESKQGYISELEKDGDTASTQTIYQSNKVVSYDQSSLCPLETLKTDSSSSNRLSTNISYIHPTTLSEHMVCLPSSVKTSGIHSNSKFNFSHLLTIERNNIGLPLSLDIWDSSNSNAKRNIQRLTYTSNNQIQLIYSPKSGESVYTYDNNNILKKVISPSGETVEIAKRDQACDLTFSIINNHGDNNFYQRFFRYDFYDRLEKEWNSYSKSSSDSIPLNQYSYRYADDKRAGLTKITKRLLGDDGTTVSSDYVLSAGNGQTLGAITSRGENGTIIAGWTSFDPGKLRTTQFPLTKLNGVDVQNLDKEMDSTDLLKMINSSVSQTSGYLQLIDGHHLSGNIKGAGILSSNERIHQNVERTFSNNIAIDTDNGTLKVTTTENGRYQRVKVYDLDNRLLSFTNEVGESYDYSYDVLGRLREVLLPDKQTQKIAIDNFGDILHIGRSGLGEMSYVYDIESGLLTSKETRGREGKIIRTTNVTYDKIGRISHSKYLSNKVEEAIQEFNYSYDGHLSDGSKQSGQLGFLSEVSSSKFQKKFNYRADGKLVRYELAIKDSSKAIHELTYNDHGVMNSQCWTVMNANGAITIRNQLKYHTDRFGRVVGVDLNERPLLHYTYNELGQQSNTELLGVDGTVVREWKVIYDDFTKKKQGYKGTDVSHSWAYNNRGLIADENYQVANASTNRKYDYYDQGFLKSTIDDGISAKQFSYSYDVIGNLIFKQNGNNKREFKHSTDVWTATADEQGEQIISYPLNDLGEVIKLNGKDLTYNAQGKIASFKNASGTLVEYVYDESGFPITKSKEGKVVEIYLGTGPTSELIIEGKFYWPIKVAGQMIGIIENSTFILTDNDIRNTPYFLSNDKKTVVLASPEGEREQSSRDQNKFSHIHDYVGRGYDSDLGAVRMGVRVYDPVTGRFLSPDRYFMENPGKCTVSPYECGNLYGYAVNDPINRIDPDGNFAFVPILIAIGVGAVIGGTANVIKNHENIHGTMDFLKFAGIGAGIGAAGTGVGVAAAMSGAALGGAFATGVLGLQGAGAGAMVLSGIGAGLGSMAATEGLSTGTSYLSGNGIQHAPIWALALSFVGGFTAQAISSGATNAGVGGSKTIVGINIARDTEMNTISSLAEPSGSMTTGPALISPSSTIPVGNGGSIDNFILDSNDIISRLNFQNSYQPPTIHIIPQEIPYR
ncbi:MAG: hypothetical protein HQK49_13240 [Oligoflexia bacterium]|nr:hypothetical protein [Oligoflexia bacterium]